MSEKKTFSFSKGYSFLFEEEGNTIEAWFSAFSGLEKVYVNGNLVCRQRSYSTDSSNSFCVGPSKYTTNLNTTSLLKGPFVCTLIKNGKPYKQQKLIFPKKGLSSKWILFFIIFSGIFGFTHSYWKLSNEFIYIFIILLSAIFFVYYIIHHKDVWPLIKNEEIIAEPDSES
ncbi:MAG: hypothetical protein ACK5ME_13110 [Parahaliea sp.]